MGIETIGQLAGVPAYVLEGRFGKLGAHLHELARGRDDRPVESFTPARSVGAEETFSSDHRDLERLELTLRAQAERVAGEVRALGYVGKTVTLKLRFRDFRTVTRRLTGEPTQEGLEIYRRTRRLLEQIPLADPVRLIGLSVSGLASSGSAQLPLFPDLAVRRARLAQAVDALARRFGDRAVIAASLLIPLKKVTPGGGAIDA
jgi:DNA polymerase-4